MKTKYNVVCKTLYPNHPDKTKQMESKTKIKTLQPHITRRQLLVITAYVGSWRKNKTIYHNREVNKKITNKSISPLRPGYFEAFSL